MSRPSSRPPAATAMMEESKEQMNKRDTLRKEYDASSVDAQTLRTTILTLQQSITTESSLQQQLLVNKAFLEDQVSVANEAKAEHDGALRQLLASKDELLASQAQELAVYKLKLTSLLNDNISELNDDAIKELNLVLKNKLTFLLQDEKENKNELNALLVYHRESELNHLQLLNAIKLSHESEIMELRQSYELQQNHLKNHYHKLMKSKREEIELAKRTEITLLEQKKANYIAALLSENKKAVDELKKYFSDIIHSNLELVKNLREEVGDAKKKEMSVSKKIGAVKRSNELLNQPLFEKSSLLQELKGKYAQYLQDKRRMAELYTELNAINANIDESKWQRELRKQRIEVLRQDRAAHSHVFTQQKFSLIQRTKFIELVQNAQIEQYRREVEKLEVAINELLLASEIDPTSVGMVSRGLEALLMEKNQLIMRLEDGIQEERLRYGQLVAEVKRETERYDIPPQELGFVPRDTLN